MADYDLERFERLVLPHLDSAYSLARYLLHDEHDAQDAVQEAALRAVRYFDGFRGGDARAWLLAIVRNCCYTWQQGRHAEPATISYTDDTVIDIADPRATDDQVVEGAERARVQAAVRALPADLREMVVLREIEQLSYREISEVVGIPIGTVMSRLSRARQRLAATLGGEAQEAS
jgi:RNA polymerase sigma-70 factor (ECF subfamily)